MKPSLLHILTLVLLLCSAATLTGAVELASSFAAQQGVDRCCNHSADEDLPPADPASHCTSGDCNCVGCCLPLLTPPPRISLGAVTEVQLRGTRHLHIIPGGITRSIDYPPEIG